MTSPCGDVPQAERGDSDHNLHLAYFDSSEDDDARFRYQKPVLTKDLAAIRLCDDAL